MQDLNNIYNNYFYSTTPPHTTSLHALLFQNVKNTLCNDRIVKMLDGGQFSDVQQKNEDNKNKLVSRKYASTQNDQFKNYADNTYVQNRNQVISPYSEHVVQNNADWPTTTEGRKKALENVNNGKYTISKKNLIDILNGNLKLSDINFGDPKINGVYIMRSLISDPSILYYIESNKISYEDIIKECYKIGTYDAMKNLDILTEGTIGVTPTYFNAYNASKLLSKFLGGE